MSEELKAIYRRWADAVNARNLEAADELYAADYVIHDPGAPDPVRGPEGVKQRWTPTFAAFPDFHLEIEDMIAEGDKLAIRVRNTGTHKGEIMGIAPTDKQVTITSISIVRIAGGQFVEAWQVGDMLGFLQQLGVIPPLGEGD